MQKVRVGVIGCGVLSESVYLPLLTEHPGYTIDFVVDSDTSRLETLGHRYGISSRSENYKKLLKLTDANAVILALPNHLHATVSCDCLNAGLNVLVEKPMATNVADAERMIDASNASGKVLAISLVRRFYETTKFAKKVIDKKIFGNLRSISFEEGCIFDWPVQTDSLINRELSGGGVLMDIGVHVVDLILYWIGEIKSYEYYDDNKGGVEAECYIKFETNRCVTGTIKLSRLRNLKNRVFFDFEYGQIEMGLRPDSNITLKLSDSYSFENKLNTQKKSQDLRDAFWSQLENFHHAITNKGKIFIPGKEGVKSIAFIEKCYQSANPLSCCYQNF